MNGLTYLLPPVTPDLGGAASILAPMGGMVIFRDAAGCMENYAVFDEPRWLGSDALIFSSDLRQMDAVLGNDTPFVTAVERAARQLKPRFIAVLGTPVPAVIGMDLGGVAAELEFRTQIPSFAVPCSGFKPWHHGAGLALKELVKRFAQADAPQPRRINLLGASPLDFSDAQLAAIKARLKRAGWQIGCTCCMDENPDAVRHLAQAERNLVLSRAGLPAAKFLKAKFGTPYTECVPLTDVQAASLTLPPEPETADTLVIGEPVAARSLAAARTAAGMPSRALSDDIPEDHLTGILREGWRTVIADPLIGLLCPPELEFRPNPHHALSSHLYPPLTPEEWDALVAT